METTERPILRLVSGPAVAHLHVRPARPSDRPAVEAMLQRSSADTLYRRFHGVLGAAGTRREVGRMVRPTASHRSWVAIGRGGVRGIATLAFEADGTAEIAFLVEDDWQRAGVGRALADATMAEGSQLGLRSVDAIVQPENFRAREFFKALAPGARSRFDGGEVVVEIPVPVVPASAAPVAPLAAAAPGA
jgi:RimJ/RimL family protein N-acetyltransferase